MATTRSAASSVMAVEKVLVIGRCVRVPFLAVNRCPGGRVFPLEGGLQALMICRVIPPAPSIGGCTARAYLVPTDRTRRVAALQQSEDQGHRQGCCNAPGGLAVQTTICAIVFQLVANTRRCVDLKSPSGLLRSVRVLTVPKPRSVRKPVGTRPRKPRGQASKSNGAAAGAAPIDGQASPP
jgi:hypothetical protein